MNRRNKRPIFADLIPDFFLITKVFYERFNFHPTLDEQLYYLRLEEEELRSELNSENISMKKVIDEYGDVLVVYSALFCMYNINLPETEELLRSVEEMDIFPYDLVKGAYSKATRNLAKTSETHLVHFIKVGIRGIIRRDKLQ